MDFHPSALLMFPMYSAQNQKKSRRKERTERVVDEDAVKALQAKTAKAAL